MIKQKMKEEGEYEPSAEELAPIIAAETEADNFAISIILKDYDDSDKKINIAFGIVTSFCSMLFAVHSIIAINGIFHPSTHERIRRALQVIEDRGVEKPDYFYHYASQVMMLVLDDFGIDLSNYDASDRVIEYFYYLLDEVDKYIRLELHKKNN
jgi:hypothetical protein